MGVYDEDKSDFDVAGYWDQRYKSGRNSGSGSYGRLAKFKADYINGLIKRLSVKDVVEFGCGDGNQLSIIDYPSYVGLDISQTIIDTCNEKFENDKSKDFHLYDPETYDIEYFKRDLAISLDVIYHLSNDKIYFAYLEHLFQSATRFVVIYSNSESLYRRGINENARYVRFRDFSEDIEKLFPDWNLIEIEPNFYPFNPSLPKETSIADFYVYERILGDGQQVRWSESDQLQVRVKKLLNKASVTDEQNQLILDACDEIRALSEEKSSRILSKLDKIETSQIERCFEKHESLLRDFLSLERQFQQELGNRELLSQEIQKKHSEMESIANGYENKIRTLESELRAKNKELNRIRQSVRYQVGYHMVRAGKSWRGTLALPVAILRIIRRSLLEKKRGTKGVKPKTKSAKDELSAQLLEDVTNVHDRFFEFLAKRTTNRILESQAIIYGDVSPNVLDGSSIWLSSIANIVSNDRPVILLVKDNITNQKVVSNLVKNENLIVVEPKDIGFDAPLMPEEAAVALSVMYSHCPRITAVITRGVNIGYEVQKKKEFSGVFYPYVTDFYEITEDGFSLVEPKVSKLKEIVLNAKTVLFQTDEIRKKIEDIVGYQFDGCKLPPTIPDDTTPSYLQTKDDNEIHIGYAGKIQPSWGVEELVDEVGKLVSIGYNIKLHIATGKIHERKEGNSRFVERIRKLLDEEFVHLYQDLSRKEALDLISKMDLVWCYRDPNLEESTLELSTKLVETAALGKPCIAYSSEINRNFLGQTYPFLIENLSAVSGIIANFPQHKETVKKQLEDLAGYVIASYSFSAVKSTLVEKLDEDSSEVFCGKKIAISGHDLKFIYPYITHLRRQGADVGIDPWDWGSIISPSVTQYYASWAEYIFCEWGLANAVWHSKNKKEGSKLFIRVHAQEVREKAERFGHQIELVNVDKFIFVSGIIREQALNLFGWPESKSVVIPNSVKNNRFYKARSQVEPILGMVGIIPTTKRLDRALDLLSALNQRGLKARLYIKGARPEELPFMRAPGRRDELEYYEQQYSRIERDPQLKGNVFFDGWGNDVELWYQKVHFILSPSDNESFHYALADGVMAGCFPIVWPWTGSVDVYCEEWIVESDAEAVSKIEKLVSSGGESLLSERARNLELIQKRYAERTVFALLDQSIEIVEVN